MADKSTTVGVNINVTDNGTTAKATKEAEKLNKTYKEAAKSASSIHVPAAQRQAQMYNSAKRAPVKDNESGIARGIGGVTGAEGRDFAKQAQGLGGLVHLYATFAANIFAVSAAFGALSKAADTTNMIKGLDQLGVASGRSLGNLSKQFASATDNAISMREAMEATVKASSSGMSSDNILRIAKNAKAASQALGVDMGDAVSRLTRGITKLEPELLDELGLFTRVDKAVADYASSVNKSVAGLTEFERRQAYANAVLTEAESKFSKIKIDANPYNQLAASMQNVLQTGLEIINVVLKPIAKLLGESPTALAAAMAGMVTVLVKQAVPAISNFRAGLADSADRARKRAMEVASSRVGRAVERDETLLKATAEELGTLDNHVRNLASSVDTLDKKYVGANSNLKKFATNVKGSTEYLGNIQNQQKAVDSLEARLKKINTLTAEGNTLHKDRLASYIKEKAIIEETISSLKRMVALQEISDRESARPANLGFFAKLSQREFDKLQRQGMAKTILSNTAENTASWGPVAAIKEANEEIKKSSKPWQGFTKILESSGDKFSWLGGKVLVARAAMVSLGTALGTLVAAFSSIAVGIGILGAGLAVLKTFFGTSDLAAREASEAVDSLNNSTVTLSKTIDDINSKPFLEQLSTESIYAKGNAIGELAASMDKLIKASKKEELSMNWIDKAWDFTKAAVGQSSSQVRDRALSSALAEGFSSLDVGPIKDAFGKRLSQAIGKDVSSLTIKDLNLELRSLSEIDLNNLAKDFGLIGKEAQLAGNKAKELKDAFEASGKKFNDYVTSTLGRGARDNFIDSLFTDVVRFNESLGTTETALAGVMEILKDPRKLVLLGDDASKSLMAQGESIKLMAENWKQAQTEVGKYTVQLAELQERLDYQKKLQKNSQIPDQEINKTRAELEATADRLNEAQDKLNSAKGTLTSAIGEVSKAYSGLLTKAIDMMKVGLKIAATEVSAAFNKGVASFSLGDTPGAERYQLQQDSALIKSQMSLQQEIINLIAATERQRIATEENTNAKKMEAANAAGPGTQQIRLMDEVGTSNRRIAKEKELVARAQKGDRTTLDELKKYLSPDNKDDLFKQAAENVQTVVRNLLEARKEMNKLAGAQKLINFKDAVLAQQDLIKLQVINQGFVLSTNKIELEKLDLIAQSNGFLNDELMRKKETIELDNNRLSFQQKALEISSQLVSAEASYNDAVKSGDKSRADISLTRKNNLLESLRLEEKSKAVNDERIVQANRLLKIERDLKYDLEEIEKSYTQQLNIQSRLETSAKLREIELDLQREMGELTEREYAAKKSAINLLNIENTKNKELLQLDKARDEIEKNRVANLAKLSAGPESDKDRERINANAASALSKVNTDAAGINAIYEATRKANLEITAFNDSLMLMDELSESLSVVFGDLGSSIGQFAKAMVQSTKALENLNKREEDLIRIKSDLQDAGDIAGEKKAEKELLNIQSKKIDILGKEAGIAKKMFGEKTAAYKVLSGLEKAAHIQKIAFAAVELVTTAKTTYANIAAAVSSIWKTAPWFVAPVVTGAFLGLMASLGFGGGGSVSIPKGFSAEDRQEVQGTGAQAWDKSGNRVQTGGGALGEEEEKSDAIVNSIDLIEKHTFESLEFSNSMLSALKSIEKNTQNMVKAAIALPGNIRLADPTREGGNFINKKKVETADKGINISGSIDKLIDGVGKFETYITSVVTSKKWFGLKTSTRTETSPSPLQDETFIKAVGSTIAAGKKSLIEAGKALGMTGVESIIGGMDIKLSVSALGKTGEEFAQEVLAELGIQLDLAAEKAFPGLKKFQQLGESYAETAFRMARTSQLVNQGMTLMGMAITKLPEVVGTATEEMYTAVSTASKNLDTAKAKVDSLKDGSWVDVWVEMSDAGGQWTKQLVVDYAALSQAEKDVIDATNKLTEAQNTLNSALTGTTTLNLEIINDLIEKTGSLEEFVSQSKFFNENFLSDQERLDISKTGLKKGLDDLEDEFKILGKTAPTTRKEFKDLVQSLDLTNETARTAYAALMDLAPAFHEVTQEIDSLVDKYKDHAREIRKLRLIGGPENIEKADALEKKDRIAAIDDDDQKLLEEEIIALEALAKTRGLETRLLEAQGLGHEALIARRKEEISQLNSTDAAIMQQIYAAEDLAKTRGLEIRLMETLGLSYNALIAKREEELKKLSDTDAAIMRRIYAAEDLAKTQDLEIQLLQVMGEEAQATHLLRQKELRSLSASNQALKIRIWRLQDEKALLDKKVSQEVRIYELLGKAEKALAITRANELKTMDPQLHASQQYIWALEDEATLKDKLLEAYDNEKQKVDDIIDSTKDHIKTLKDYKDALLLGDKTILTPLERYQEARAQFDRVSFEATNGATEDIRNNALEKLPEIADTFLDASRELYASSAFYTSDFNMVTSILDTTAASLQSQLTEAEKQLAELEKHSDYLESIRDSVGTVADLLPRYLEAVENTETARGAAAAAGSEAAGGVFVPPTVEEEKVVTVDTIEEYLGLTNDDFSAGLDKLAEKIKESLIESIDEKLITKLQETEDKILPLITNINDNVWLSKVQLEMLNNTSSLNNTQLLNIGGYLIDIGGYLVNMATSLVDIYGNISTLIGVTGGLSSAISTATTPAVNDSYYYSNQDWGGPGVGNFATGGNASGLAMVGESGPELVRFNNPTRVHSNTSTNTLLNDINKELIQEVKYLREEVTKLREEQQAQTGNIIQSNYDANRLNAEEIVRGQDEAVNAASWKQRNMPKIA